MATLERLLTLGGRVRRWVGAHAILCPWYFTLRGLRQTMHRHCRDGVEVDSLWAIVVPFANVLESPRENSKVVATAGHELVAVTKAANWDAPKADESWQHSDGTARPRMSGGRTCTGRTIPECASLSTAVPGGSRIFDSSSRGRRAGDPKAFDLPQPGGQSVPTSAVLVHQPPLSPQAECPP